MVDKTSGYIYNTAYSDRTAWRCVDETGNKANEFRTLSTKVAFAWYALYEDSYAIQLFLQLNDLYDSGRGWYSGEYESTGLPNTRLTLATNSMVLESMKYRKDGPVLKGNKG
jgi:hypothetical protein